MVQILPGWGTELGAAIGSVAQLAGKIADPNRQETITMLHNFATNPELLQRVADLEKLNPGTIEKMGLGHLKPIIDNVAESASQQFERENAGILAEVKKGTLANQAKKTKIDTSVLTKAADLLGSDPNYTLEAAYNTLGVKTPEEKKRQEQEDTARAQNISLNELKLDELKRARDAFDKSKEFNGVPLNQIARSVMTGKISALQAQTIFSNPELKSAVDVAISNLRDQQNFEQQQTLLGIEQSLRSTSSSEVKEGTKISLAASRYAASGEVGTLDAWHDYMFDPKVSERVRELVKTPDAKVSVNEEPYKEIADYLRQTSSRQAIEQSGKVMNVIGRIAGLQSKVTNAGSDDERASALADLNIALNERAQLGGPQVTASWHENGWGFDGGAHIEFKDKNGKALTPHAVASTVENSTYVEPELSQKGQQALNLIQKADAPNVALGKLKMQNPEVGAEVEKYMKAKGLIK